MARKYTKKEREIHNEAVKLRKMTDEQLVNYVIDSYVKGFNEGLIFRHKEIHKAISNINGIGPKTLLKITAVLEEL